MNQRHHFQEDLKALYQNILKMGTLVEEALRKALTALSTGDVTLANQVIENDLTIDQLQIKIEDRCTTIIATEQPVASDLREIITSIKIATHLERIGDHARHLAKAVSTILDDQLLQTIPEIEKMTEIGISMVHDSVSAFVEQDTEKAVEVAKRDDLVDSLHGHLYKEILTIMEKNPEKLDEGVNLLFLNRFLERLGDHVTNMCEWVIFAKKGTHIELNR
jgi:phosphate transport system protein